MNTSKQQHELQIRDQFTKQAIPFTQLKGHSNSIQTLIELSGASSSDQVLDVACGPGIVACDFAQIASAVSGIDLTEKMIDEARKRQRRMKLENIEWKVGAADALPYPDAYFSIVLSRYTFHHFIDPAAVLAEMCRVCRPGGRVMVVDPVLPATKVAAYNAMERLRDPSHTHALSTEQIETMIRASGLKDVQRASYSVEMELESQLAASFPNPGDDARIRDLFKADVMTNAMGVNAEYVGNAIHFSYPISVYVGVVD